MNLWKKKRNKLDVTAEYIAGKLGLPIKTYLEIERGERTMPKNSMDKFLELNKQEITIDNITVNEWFNNTDIKALRESFNHTQQSVADVIGTSRALLTAPETPRLKHTTSPRVRMALYYFFSNPLNKNVKAPTYAKNKPHKKPRAPYSVHKNDEYSTIARELGVTKTTLAEIIGIHPATVSKRIHRCIPLSKEELSLIEEYKKPTPISAPIPNPTPRVEPQEEEPAEDYTPTPILTEAMLEYSTLLKDLNNKLSSENFLLKAQINRYNKLIDLLKKGDDSYDD